MTGRNAPCPCGSGKKYKKCCGKAAVVSIEELLVEELQDITRVMLAYSQEMAGVRLAQAYRKVVEQLPHLKVLDEGGEMLYAFWAMCFEKERQGKTLLDSFVSDYAADIPRERTREIVRSWRGEVRVIAGVVKKMESSVLTVWLPMTDETIHIIDKINEHEEGEFILSMVLPVEDKWMFLMIPFIYAPGAAGQMENILHQQYEKSHYDSVADFLKGHFFTLLNECYLVVQDIQWEDPRHQDVYERFSAFMTEQGADKDTIEDATALWWAFCQEHHPKPRNTGIFAAAVYYLFSTEMMRVPFFSQKELAGRFGTSANSISTRANDLIDFMYEKTLEMPQQSSIPMLASERALWEMSMRMEEREAESVEEVQQFMNATANQPFVPKNDEQKAQAMLYDAYEDEGPMRRELARLALECDPDASDAYSIFAEYAGETGQRESYLKQAIEAGKRKLGKEFFAENTGHFWGIVTTRPFMRAMQNYAVFLEEQNRFKEAAAQYEEMLRLNPNDNQGNRDRLVLLYMRLGAWTKATKLLKEYEGGFIGEAYHYVLLELLQNGVTAKAKRLWQEAVLALPGVFPYLTEKKALLSSPEFYQKGSESEAIVYVESTIDLWIESGAGRSLPELVR